MSQVEKIELISVLIESITWGAATNSMLRTLWAMYQLNKENKTVTRSRHDIAKAFQIAPYIMLFLATSHLAVDWYRNIHAFTGLQSRQDTILFLSGGWASILKDAIYTVATYFADALLMLRAYIVWNRQLLPMIFPLLCFIGSIVSGTLPLFYESKGLNVLKPPVSQAITAALVLVAANNFSSTFLIIFRIWQVRRAQQWAASTAQTVNTPIIKLLLETGAIYCLSVLTILVLLVSKQPSQTIVLNSTPSLITLLFCALLLTSVERQRSRTTGRIQAIYPNSASIIAESATSGVQVGISKFIDMDRSPVEAKVCPRGSASATIPTSSARGEDSGSNIESLVEENKVM